MIRHSSSFFISIVIHLILLFSAFFAWSSYSETKDEYKEESIHLQLCNVKYEQEALSAKKPIEPKVQKKIVEAPEPKPEPKPPKKEIAIEKALPKAQEIQKSEVLEEPKEEEKVIEVEQEKVQEVVHSRPKKEAVEPKSEQSREVDATEEYLKINTQKISELIRENLYYPMAARKRNITGRVSVKFTLCADGKVKNIKIIDASSDILSRAALKTIEELSGKFPKPGTNLVLTLPIDYNLN